MDITNSIVWILPKSMDLPDISTLHVERYTIIMEINNSFYFQQRPYNSRTMVFE